MLNIPSILKNISITYFVRMGIMVKKSTKKRPAKQSITKAVPTKKAIVPSILFWKKNWLPALLLFAIAVALYAYSTTFEYVLDDQIVLTNNTYTKQGVNGIKDILTKESMSGRFGGQKDLIVGARYRPLSLVTFALEYQFVGLNPFVSHLINVLLYGLLAVLLYRVLSLCFPIKEQWYFSLAFLASLLFVVHPVHTEVVANVKGRDEIMTLLGALAALYYAIRYVQKSKWIYLLLSGIVFFLALLSKENALTFLAVVPLTLYFFKNASFKQIGITLAPLMIASLAYLVIRYQVIGYFLSADGREITDIMNNPFYGLNASDKMATVFYTLGLYLKLLIFPHPLTHDYYPYQIPIIGWGDMRAIIPLVLHIGLGVLALLGLKKKSILSYGILFYLATLSIVSNVPFTVGTFMNERFIFIPSIGFCLIVVWLLKDQLAKWMNGKQVAKTIGLGILALMTVGFGWKTVDRVPDWKNRLTLNTSGASASPNSARANCFLGTAIFEEEYRNETNQQKKKELIKEVAYFIDRALSIYPTYGSALTMHSGVVAEEYKYDRNLDKLLAEFHSILQRKSNVPFIGQYIEYLLGSANPQKLADFCYKVGYNHFTETKKDYNSAIKYLKYGLQATPNDRRLLQGIGQTYQLMGNTQQANTYLSRL